MVQTPLSGHPWKRPLQLGLTALSLHVCRSYVVCADDIRVHTSFLQRGYRHGGTEEQNTRPTGSARGPCDPAQDATLPMLPYPPHLENSVAQVLDKVLLELESQCGDRSQHCGAEDEHSGRQGYF